MFQNFVCDEGLGDVNDVNDVNSVCKIKSSSSDNYILSLYKLIKV